MTKQASKESIDRLSFTVPVGSDNREKSFQRFIKVVNGERFRFIDEADYFMVNGGYRGSANDSAFSSRLYKDMASLKIGKGKKISIQVNPVLFNKTAWARFDFNPSKFSASEIKKIEKLIRYVSVVPSNIPLSDVWSPTRLDVALDFKSFHISDIDLIKTGARTSKAIINKAGGEKESLYIGANRSQNSAVIYNKLAEISKNDSKYEDNKLKPLTRIEVRLSGTALKSSKNFPHSISGFVNVDSPFRRCRLYDRTIDWSKMSSDIFSPEFVVTYLNSGLQEAYLEVSDRKVRIAILKELRAFERHELCDPYCWSGQHRIDTFKIIKPFFKAKPK